MTKLPKTKFKHFLKPYQMFLGIDGGGTKTHAVIINRDKKIIGEGLAGASNPLRVGVKTASENILKATDLACDSANRNPDEIVAIQCGLAGVRREDVRRLIKRRISQNLSLKTIDIVTDAEIALFGTTLGKAGAVIIAGTGSVAYGKNSKGETAIAGGWGPIAGDEGGGISISRDALQAIAKELDGRGEPTKLSEVGMEYFRASSPENLLVAIYSPQVDNRKLAGFAKFVAKTAKDGDKIANQILEKAGNELAIAAYAVLKKLKLLNKKVTVGFVGSIFKSEELITAPLLKTLNKYAPKAVLQKPKINPANAAAVMAFENFKNEFTDNRTRKSQYVKN